MKLWSMDGAAHHTLSGHSDDIEDMVFSPDGTCLASASKDSTARIWICDTGKLYRCLKGHTAAVYIIRFSFDGKTIATCSSDKTIRLWNANTGDELNRVPSHSLVTDLAFSPDGKVMAWSSAAGNIGRWDLLMRKCRLGPHKAHTESIGSIAFSAGNELLISSSSDGELKVWDTNGKLLTALNVGTHATTSAAFLPDSKYAVSCSDDENISFWDLSTASRIHTLEVGAKVRKVAFSRCGRYIETDRGTLLAPMLCTERTSIQPPAIHALFATRQWLQRDGKKMLLLPDNYIAVSVATYRETIVLGHRSGALSFVRFVQEQIPRQVLASGSGKPSHRRLIHGQKSAVANVEACSFHIDSLFGNTALAKTRSLTLRQSTLSISERVSSQLLDKSTPFREYRRNIVIIQRQWRKHVVLGLPQNAAQQTADHGDPCKTCSLPPVESCDKRRTFIPRWTGKTSSSS